MGDKLKDHLPAVYGAGLPAALFDLPAVAETRATCGDCAMCPKGQAAGLDTATFRPDIKCCSYHPTLPNYLAGAVLADGSAEMAKGRERIRAKLSARIGVTPHWLAAPRKYLVLLEASRDSSFGRSEALLCPYFERADGTCTIWRHRESVCATFFCKHSAGAAGWEFWAALRRYLYHAERTLSRHAARQVAPEAVDPELPRNKLTREDLEDGPPPDEDYARMWGGWVGREEAFYVACHEVVSRMAAAEVSRIVTEGPGAELMARAIEAHGRATRPVLASRLKKNPEMRVLQAEGGVAVTTYSRYDALMLTPDLFEVVSLFTGERSTAEVIEGLKREHDVTLPESLLLELQVHGVVVPAL